MAEATPEIDLSDAGNFAFWTQVTIRYSDEDSMGHVNNTAYPTYVEAGRTMFLNGLLDKERDPDIDFTLASVKIDYLNEMRYPGLLNVGTRILRLGNKSMTLGSGIFRNGGIIATALSVNVFFHMPTRSSVAIPDYVRAALDADPMQKERGAGTEFALTPAST